MKKRALVCGVSQVSCCCLWGSSQTASPAPPKPAWEEEECSAAFLRVQRGCLTSAVARHPGRGLCGVTVPCAESHGTSIAVSSSPGAGVLRGGGKTCGEGETHGPSPCSQGSFPSSLCKSGSPCLPPPFSVLARASSLSLTLSFASDPAAQGRARWLLGLGGGCGLCTAPAGLSPLARSNPAPGPLFMP